MKIAFPFNTFPGGFLKSIETSFRDLGHDTFTTKAFHSSFLPKVLKRSKYEPLVSLASQKIKKSFNEELLKQILNFKPDIFINNSGGGLFPSTVKKIKEETNCLMITLIADNPCDPDPRRDQYFPMTLQFYDIFLNPEPVWDKIINNLCENPKIIRFLGGYDPNNFFPIKSSSISDSEYQELSCDVSFTGGSYNQSAEGAYRSGIMSQFSEYNLKIWGDSGWKYRFKFMPEIEEAYQGPRLSYEKLRKLYTVSKINLNIPSPQIFSSFQPRVFDIAAVKGFQIIDHSRYLDDVFKDIYVPTFKSIKELKEKVEYYIKHEDQKERIKEEMYKIVVENYTWQQQTKELLKKIL